MPMVNKEKNNHNKKIERGRGEEGGRSITSFFFYNFLMNAERSTVRYMYPGSSTVPGYCDTGSTTVGIIHTTALE